MDGSRKYSLRHFLPFSCPSCRTPQPFDGLVPPWLRPMGDVACAETRARGPVDLGTKIGYISPAPTSSVAWSPPVARHGPKDTDVTRVFPCFSSPGLSMHPR